MSDKTCKNCSRVKHTRAAIHESGKRQYVCLDAAGWIIHSGYELPHHPVTRCGQWVAATIDPGKEKAAETVGAVYSPPARFPVVGPCVDTTCVVSDEIKAPINPHTSVINGRLVSLLNTFNTTTCSGCPFESLHPDTHEHLCSAGDPDDCIPVLLRWLRGGKKGGE